MKVHLGYVLHFKYLLAREYCELSRTTMPGQATGYAAECTSGLVDVHDGVESQKLCWRPN